MADFTKFGSGVVAMADAISGGYDRAGIADFIILQQQAIQEGRIKDRKEGAAKQGVSQSGKPAGQASDPAVTGRASGAMLRMKAMLGKK